MSTVYKNEVYLIIADTANLLKPQIKEFLYDTIAQIPVKKLDIHDLNLLSEIGSGG